MKRAALYARYSTESQRPESIADQQNNCAHTLEAHGLKIVARFADPETSGGTARRPGYQSMLAAARRGEFEFVVAEDVSRFWRNRKEYGNASTEWEDAGINLVTQCGCDTAREGWMIVSIKVALAEEERKRGSARTRRGLEGVAKEGRFVGGRPYGYRVNDPERNDLGKGQIIIDPAQAKWVRWIFDRYAEGQSALWIAKELNRLGVPSPGSSWNRQQRRARGWMASAISGDPARGLGILNNEKYLGKMTWRRTTVSRSSQDSSDVRIRKTPEAQVYRRQDERLRIVPQPLWDRVKERQRRQAEVIGAPIRAALKNKPGAGRSPKHLCSGLLRCSVCGANFVMTSATHYSCSTYRYGGPSACTNNILVPKDSAERAILTAPAEQLLPRLDSIKREVIRLWGQRGKGPGEGEVRRLQKELRRVTDEIDRIVIAIATGGLGASSALAQALPEREAARERLQAELAAATRLKGKVTAMIPDLEGRLRRALCDLPKLARGRSPADITRAREALRSFYGGPVQVAVEVRDGKRMPVGFVEVPALSLLLVAGEDRTDFSGSGGRLVPHQTDRARLNRPPTRCCLLAARTRSGLPPNLRSSSSALTFISSPGMAQKRPPCL